jgi:hypothetical protein
MGDEKERESSRNSPFQKFSTTLTALGTEER